MVVSPFPRHHKGSAEAPSGYLDDFDDYTDDFESDHENQQPIETEPDEIPLVEPTVAKVAIDLGSAVSSPPQVPRFPQQFINQFNSTSSPQRNPSNRLKARHIPLI
jgi:hypothetical protein